MGKYPACKDCKYLGSIAGDRCYHPSIPVKKNFDPIRGYAEYKGMSAMNARKAGAICGKEGKLFKKANILKRIWMLHVVSMQGYV